MAENALAKPSYTIEGQPVLTQPAAMTSSILNSAGAFVTNGEDAGTFGAAPLIIAPTVQTASNSIASQGWAVELAATVDAINDSIFPFTANMKADWNQVQSTMSNPFFAATGAFSPNASDALAESLLSSKIEISWDFGMSWASQSIGGPVVPTPEGAGDAKKFGKILSSNINYVDSTNQFVNGANNSKTGSQVWLGSDNRITGGIADVSNNFERFANDLDNLGTLIDWSNLPDLGNPGQLVVNLFNAGNLGTLGDIIGLLPLEPNNIVALGGSLANAAYVIANNEAPNMINLGIDLPTVIQQGPNLPATLLKQIYIVLQVITGDDLAQIQQILGSKIKGLQTAADLLNPMKYLPTSYMSLTTYISTPDPTLVPIYVDQSGSVNSRLNNYGDNLKSILPPDQAVANAALSQSLQQIKGVSNISTDRFSFAVRTMETNRGLPDIQGQSQSTNQAVVGYWKNENGKQSNITLNTGYFEQYTLGDIMGYVAGIRSEEPLTKLNTVLSQLNGAGAFDDYIVDNGPTDPDTGLYKVIQYFCQGEYGPVETAFGAGDWTVIIPAGVKGEGSYGPFATADEAFQDAWINGILPAMKVQIGETYSSYTSLVTKANEYNQTFTEQLAREYINQQRSLNANGLVDFESFSPTNESATNLAQSLHSIGTDTSYQGAAKIFEMICNKNSLGGQSVVSSMREGRNIARMAIAGIEENITIDRGGNFIADTSF